MHKQVVYAIGTGLLLLTLTGCSEFGSPAAMASHTACLKGGGPLAQTLHACDVAIRSHRYTGSYLADLYFMKGIHQQDAGRHTAAIQSFRLALKQNPKDSTVYYYLSMSQLRLGHFAEAQQDFETAHRLN